MEPIDEKEVIKLRSVLSDPLLIANFDKMRVKELEKARSQIKCIVLSSSSDSEEEEEEEEEDEEETDESVFTNASRHASPQLQRDELSLSSPRSSISFSSFTSESPSTPEERPNARATTSLITIPKKTINRNPNASQKVTILHFFEVHTKNQLY
jgi:hypothetical protein